MNHSAEERRATAETHRIGAEGGRQTAEAARVVTEEGRTADREKRAAHRRHVSWAQAGAYLGLAVVAAWGFYQADQTQDQLCTATAENRTALREVVASVSDLGSDLVGPPPTSASQQMIRDFQERELGRLTLPVCGS